MDIANPVTRTAQAFQSGVFSHLGLRKARAADLEAISIGQSADM
jgi:hypothetical protein